MTCASAIGMERREIDDFYHKTLKTNPDQILHVQTVTFWDNQCSRIERQRMSFGGWTVWEDFDEASREEGYWPVFFPGPDPEISGSAELPARLIWENLKFSGSSASKLHSEKIEKFPDPPKRPENTGTDLTNFRALDLSILIWCRNGACGGNRSLSGKMVGQNWLKPRRKRKNRTTLVVPQLEHSEQKENSSELMIPGQGIMAELEAGEDRPLENLPKFQNRF